MKLIDISTPKHPNTFTMVDDEDFDWLSKWRWSLSKVDGYPVRYEYSAGGKRVIFMHREILKPPAGMVGDHRFGDKLDHRRENLRICTYGGNSMNRKPTSGRALPKGVCWLSENRRFQARIGVEGQTINLGSFLTEFEAEVAYIQAAKKYHGEFARTLSLHAPAAGEGT